jgi:hypothetical protein
MAKLTKMPGWAILTEDEKVALSLAFAHDKSSWEAGEIMKKPHYKYLEIKARAAHFLKIFTEYFRLYPSLIPDKLNTSESFKDYIRLTVGKRMKVREAVALIGNPDYVKTNTRNESLLKDFKLLEKSNAKQNVDFFRLLVEFDKWNNFRILPPGAQEPTAFKRRNKHKNKKLLKAYFNLDSLVMEKIQELAKKQSKDPKLFLPLIDKSKPTKPVMIIPITVGSVEMLSELNLFIFKDEIIAAKYGSLVWEYMTKQFKHCRDGQVFWPQYRQIIKHAVNYHTIQHINIYKQRNIITKDFGKRDNLYYVKV